MSKKKQFQALSAPKGVPDYFPPQSAAFYKVRQTMVEQAHLSGFQHIELPIFEDTALFARGVGESTDVVSKEMYTFADRGDRSVTLRPEGTAGVMRSVIEHNLDRGQLPVKLNYFGPFFRYERPQAGRYRQLQQVGVEAIGVDDPALDAGRQLRSPKLVSSRRKPLSPSARKERSAKAMTSASSAGSSTPMASTPTCCSWR